jgi:hypothetical protein
VVLADPQELGELERIIRADDILEDRELTGGVKAQRAAVRGIGELLRVPGHWLLVVARVLLADKLLLLDVVDLLFLLLFFLLLLLFLFLFLCADKRERE